MTIAISTSWIGDRLSDPEVVVDTLKKVRVRAVELDYRLNRSVFHPLRELLKRNRIDILSLHNFCPCPAIVPKAPPGGDYFSLSSLDTQIRNHAVEWTARTIENANDCEAGRVVLHCGALAAPRGSGYLYAQILKNGRIDDAQRLSVRQALEELESSRPACLDALMFSLERLIAVAERNQIVLGLETRFHFYELPGFEEMSRLLSEFDGAPIGYWHDTGHAHSQEILGVVEKGQWLDAFGEQLVGIHLHDAKVLNDHLAPGKGDIDFSLIKPFFEKPQPIVLELAPGTSDADLKQAVDITRMLEGKKGNHHTDYNDFSLDLPKDFY